MPIRFVAALAGDSATFTRALPVPEIKMPANDNAAGFTRDALLCATLKHFAQHGLAAAERARQNAERAYHARDHDDYQRWLEICRALDHRMAAAMAGRRARDLPRRG